MKSSAKAVREPVVRFPVMCPKCDQELLLEMPVGHIAASLMEGQILRLYAVCHNIFWNAGMAERQQIREYLGAGVIAPTPRTVSCASEGSDGRRPT
jgi:aspartate-semialdehyde dehydrogenase